MCYLDDIYDIDFDCPNCMDKRNLFEQAGLIFKDIASALQSNKPLDLQRLKEDLDDLSGILDVSIPDVELTIDRTTNTQFVYEPLLLAQ